MIIFTDNIIENEGVTISLDRESIIFPASNLLDTKLARFTRVLPGDNVLEISCGAAVSIDSVIIGGVNPYSEGGANFSSCVFSSNADNFAAKTTMTKADYEAHLFEMFDSPITASVFRITFSGAGNKDIGAIFLGVKTPLPGMDPSQTINLKWTNQTKRSKSGQTYGDMSSGYDAIEVKIPFPRYNDVSLKEIQRIGEKHRNVKPLFMKVWNKYNGVRLLYCVISGDSIDTSRSGALNKQFKSDITFAETF